MKKTGSNSTAATRVRRVLTKGKKASHMARKDIEDIEKGNKNPVVVDSFFDHKGESCEARQDCDDCECEE